MKIAAGKATISTPGGTTVTEMKNTSRLRLKLKVLGPLGEELPGAVLRVTRDNGSPMLYKTNEAGAALLEQMPAGIISSSWRAPPRAMCRRTAPPT